MSVINPKCHDCNLDMDECKCKKVERRRPSFGDIVKQNEQLRSIIQDILWMARRYASGRKTYSVKMINDAIDLALELGIDIGSDSTVGGMYAKDGMFDKEWFEDNKDKL